MVYSVRQRFVHFAALLAVITSGIFLRLYLISDQVLIDDEWHSLYFVICRSWQYLLTHYTVPGATSLPLNLYEYILLKTVGWNEVLLRVPSLLSGIMLLFLFPYFLAKVVNYRTTLIATSFLAISPLLIFYSRLCRPYSALALMEFLVVMWGYLWLRSGRLREGVLYVIASAVAISLHLFAVVAVVSPIAWGVFLKFLQKQHRNLGQHVIIGPSGQQMLLALLWTAVLATYVVLPGFVSTYRQFFDSVILSDCMTFSSLFNFSTLLSGSGYRSFTICFLLLIATGAFLFMKKDLLLGGMIVWMFVAFFWAQSISSPDSIHAAIVIARYSIALFPFAYLLAAYGLDAFLRKTRTGRKAVPSLFLLLFFVTAFWCGPLRQTYSSPNNFTNHSVFQQSYKPIDWDSSFCSQMQSSRHPRRGNFSATEISPFYAQLANHSACQTIVEFPTMVGDAYNPHYYYQHFHKKRVLLGYCPCFKVSVGVSRGLAYAETWMDEILSRTAPDGRSALRNMVDMSDIPALIRTGASYVILHKKFEAEPSPAGPAHPCIIHLNDSFRLRLGAPVYEDHLIVVYPLVSKLGSGRYATK